MWCRLTWRGDECICTCCRLFSQSFLGSEDRINTFSRRSPAQINYTKGTTVHQTCLVSLGPLRGKSPGGKISNTHCRLWFCPRSCNPSGSTTVGAMCEFHNNRDVCESTLIEPASLVLSSQQWRPYMGDYYYGLLEQVGLPPGVVPYCFFLAGYKS